MGLLDFLTGNDTPYDREAAHARVRTLESTLPAGAQIQLTEPEKGIELTYLVQAVADRSQSSALLASVVEVVRAGDERWSVHLSVHDSDDEHAPYSAFALPDHAVPALDVLAQAHDDLYAAIPTTTISLDAEDGAFTISDVPRDAAVATAQVAVRWWEGVLQAAGSRWSASSLAVEVGIAIGVDGAHAEVVYGTTIERDPDALGSRSTDNGSRHVSDAQWAQRVSAAWDDNLPALEALVGLPVPPDHAVEVSFTDDSLAPQLTVCHHETYDEDEDAARALVVTIRELVPGSTLEVG
ncbi:hypothetical protein [Cellulomonas sp. S1-8]|uniref:hypothetical protein n=1 Tax=Cellulomonas sp. S1-8 TaxID=2904790 RepID=UPI0022437E23|nr:hypothetical protein [Cellulomonas sp. S1-8]UZN03416.1 hypothetical protein OKX07_00270 [Cellulomonas sp. S1-8]